MNTREIVMCAIFAVAGALGGCASGLASAEAKLAIDEQACVDTATTKPQADACRAAARASMCANYPGLDPDCPDAGDAGAATDGGHE